MSILDNIIAAARRDLAKREHAVPFDDVQRRAHLAPAPIDVIDALRRGPGAVKIIAEIKRSSPSQGHIADIPDPAQLAHRYESGGAAMVSCLTEREFFHGSLDDLAEVRQAVSIPVLHKDLVISSYQIHEARAYGADAVLLVVAALEDNQLQCLIERTESLGMHALVEAQSRLEVFRALDAGARIIGVNARDVDTLDIDRAHVAQVIDVIPAEVVAVAESGVRGTHDVFEYAQAGADAVLVGDVLVRSEVPEERVADMVSAGAHPALRADRKERVRRAVLDHTLRAGTV